jgi:hypothetical protein
MTKQWIDTSSIRQKVGDFFSENKSDITQFGSTVNQTFEAFVFASLVNWYSKNNWKINFIHPISGSNIVKLKFSTRGRPSQYTYALCTKETEKIQIRHSLRVATCYHRPDFSQPANVVLDVAVISDTDLSNYKTDAHIENSYLITFGEAKHMSAFAELIANFIGLVHEISPHVVAPIRPYIGPIEPREHPAPFLYVSGHLNRTAQGIVESIRYRGYDIDVYDYQSGAFFGITLPVGKPSHLKKTTSP